MISSLSMIKTFIWKLLWYVYQVNHKLCPAVLPPNAAVLLCLKKCIQALILILTFPSTLAQHLEEGTAQE